MRQHVHERRLGALDLRRQDGLLTDVHPDEEIGVRKELGGSVEASQLLIGFRQESQQPRRIAEGRVVGERSRDENPVTCWLHHLAPRPARLGHCFLTS
jgi:hypothetical protein